MSEETVERTLDSDAPLSAAKHQRDVGRAAAEERGWREAAVIGRTVTINRPRAELYAFWRDFRNLARFLENIERVDIGDDRRSHWVIKAPAGRTVEWDSQITEDEPDRLIAWKSLDGGDIKNTGRIEFTDAAPGRGTLVTATIVYDPPGGDVGKLIGKLFQKEPKMQARRDLRRFKQLMETGEISTSAAPDAGRVVDDGRRHQRAAARRCVGEFDPAGILDVAAVQRLPRDQPIRFVLGDLRVPFDRAAGRRLDHPVGPPVVADVDPLDVLQEAREVPEIAPEGVELSAGSVDRDCAADDRRLAPTALFSRRAADVPLVLSGRQRRVAIQRSLDDFLGHLWLSHETSNCRLGRWFQPC